MVEKQIQSLCESMGVLQYGFADMENTPQQLAPRFPTALSFAVALVNGVMDEIDQAPTHTYFSLYRTVNRHIDEIGLRLCLLLEREGYKAFFVPASQSISVAGTGYQAAFSHRSAAYGSGIGFIGKNNSIVHPKAGPRLRLGTVLTTFKPEDYNTPLENIGCGSCMRCVEACPALALYGTAYSPGTPRDSIVDVATCSQYMHKHFQHIGRGSVCGVCIAACPFGGGRK